MAIYLSKEHLEALTPSWSRLTSLMEKVLIILNQGDFAQPIKPYLRYHQPLNRIIAMPAFVGGSFNIAGIKWIASFPDNLKNQLPRSHAVTILNDYQSGKPLAILSSSKLSGLRTAAISGYVIKRFANKFKEKKLNVGITGFGPIGQLHVEMLSEILEGRLNKINIYDIEYKTLGNRSEHCQFVKSWQEAYKEADIFITCTTSKERYIDHLPKEGSLQLNVSLRDYFADIVLKSSCIIVDDWQEICRENTDIEKAFLEFGLQASNTISLKDLLHEETFAKVESKRLSPGGFLSFHFMGMAVFDVALSGFYYEQAMKEKIGIKLPE